MLRMTINNPNYFLDTYAQGDVFEGDTYSDLTDVVTHATPEFRAIQSAADRYWERMVHINAAVIKYQKILMEDYVNSGGIIDEWIDSLFIDVLFNDEHDKAAGCDWQYPIPFVYSAERFEDLTPPTGNVVELSAADERVFIMSLASIGFITVEDTED